MPRRKVIITWLVAVLVIGLGVSLYFFWLSRQAQARYQQFFQLAAPTASTRLLVVAPHQDDEVLGAAGYISQATAAGASIRIVFATNGNKHGLMEIRNQEATRADAALGVAATDLRFYDFPDGKLAAHSAELTQKLTAEVADFKPTVILATLPEDRHPDHAAVGRVVSQLKPDSQLKPESGQTWQNYYYLVHYTRFPWPVGNRANDYLLPPNRLAAKYSWTVFPLTAQTQALKLKVIKNYHSQLSLKNPVLRELLFSFNRRNELFAQPNR